MPSSHGRGERDCPLFSTSAKTPLWLRAEGLPAKRLVLGGKLEKIEFVGCPPLDSYLFHRLVKGSSPFFGRWPSAVPVTKIEFLSKRWARVLVPAGKDVPNMQVRAVCQLSNICTKYGDAGTSKVTIKYLLPDRSSIISTINQISCVPFESVSSKYSGHRTPNRSRRWREETQYIGEAFNATLRY